jgi:hypothetical protein
MADLLTITSYGYDDPLEAEQAFPSPEPEVFWRIYVVNKGLRIRGYQSFSTTMLHFSTVDGVNIDTVRIPWKGRIEISCAE